MRDPLWTPLVHGPTRVSFEVEGQTYRDLISKAVNAMAGLFPGVPMPDIEAELHLDVTSGIEQIDPALGPVIVAWHALVTWEAKR